MSNTSLGTAIVTGASSGIGAVYADRLAHRGYDLVLVARNQARMEKLAQDIKQKTGRKVEILVADLTQSADINKVAQRVASPDVTLLINNAGSAMATPLLASDPAVAEDMIKLNVISLMHLSHAAAQAFVTRGGGTIINISSVVAMAHELLNGSYSGTKAFVLNFSRSMHNELHEKGLRVQAVLPGATATELWGNAGVSLSDLPPEWIMTTEDMVDAALVGLDAGEVVTIPALPDAADWEAFDAARQKMLPNLSRKTPAARYLKG
ncbi:MAG TPA: SDR family oxidoreductase [Rhodocyclaceae bacterium]|nr:SDR family oxidoreductase [Rhodocyclaceae bacterium]